MGKYSKRRSNRTKRRVKKGSSKVSSKKRVRKTHRRKRFSKNIFGGGTQVQTPLEDQPPLTRNSKPLDRAGVVAEAISSELEGKKSEASSEEEKEKYEEMQIAVRCAGPLHVAKIMTTSQKNMEKIKSMTTDFFKKGVALTTTIFAGPLIGAIAGKTFGLLARITEKIYKNMNDNAESLGKARKESKEKSTLEDHRVLMSLMVNNFMPELGWMKKTLFLKLCRFWVIGGTLINKDWWAKPPLENVDESDPRFKPSTAEKEFYDRLWLLCKTFIGLGGMEWNKMIKEVETDMGKGEFNLVMAKMKGTLETEDVQSLKSVLGEVFVGDLLNLVSSEMDVDIGGLFSDVNEGITEGMAEIKDSLPPSVDVSYLTKGTEVAQEFYNSVLSGKQCSEDDTQCRPGDKVITEGKNEGVVIDEAGIDPDFKQRIDNRYAEGEEDEDRVYVLFEDKDLPAAYKTETYEPHRKDKVYVFVYNSGQLKKRESREEMKEKAKDYFIKKIQENVGDGGTDETATSEPGAADPTPKSDQ